MENRKSALAIFGIILAIGLIAAAFVMGQQFKNLRQTGTITVKGVAEAYHTSSLGTWRVEVKGWGASYAEAMQDNQRNLNQAVKFLTQNGFVETEREILPIEVNAYEERYENDKGEMRYRQNGYVAERVLLLKTQNLDNIKQAYAEFPNLTATNQYLTARSPDYYLEDLQSIKRDLISKATQDAYVRAEEFAKTSHVNVGLLKSASQGSFSISAAQSNEDSGDYDEYNTSSIEKKVRLVVTIQYGIE